MSNVNDHINEEKAHEVSEPDAPKKKSGGVKFILALLSILFVLAAVLAVVGYDVWRVVFNPPLMKTILLEEFVGSDLVPRILADLSLRRAEERVAKGESLSGVNEPDIQLLLSYVSFEDWVRIRDLIVADAFVEDIVSVTVDGIYVWLDSEETSPQFVWDMTPLKDKLVGGEGEEVVMIAYESMPECTQPEIDDFTSRLAAVPPGVEVLYNLCRFPPPWKVDQIEDYVNALIDVNQNVPEYYNFGDMLAGTGGNVAAMKGVLRTARLVGQWGWVVPLALLGLIAAIGVRSFRSLGGWVGVPLVITGGLVVGVAIPVRRWLLTQIINRFPFQVSDLLREELWGSLVRMTGYIFRPILVQGLIALGLGVVLVILGLVIRRRSAQTSAGPEDGSNEVCA